MFSVARGCMGALASPMRRKSTDSQCRFGATVSLTILPFAVLLAVIAPAFAIIADFTPLAPEKVHGHLIANDHTPAGIPYLLGSFNGLLIDHKADETGETRGLDIVSRASAGGTPLGNNRYETMEIAMGALQQWSFSAGSAASNSVNTSSNNQSNNTKRATTTVYLSLTICSKPILKESISNTAQDLPQLAVYVSTSSSLQQPGPGKGDGDQSVYHSMEGYMNAIVTTESDVYIGIAAPEGGDFTGSYSYQVAASTDDFFHGANDQDAMLLFVDSGSDTALLTTTSLAGEILTEEQRKQWNDSKALYTMFVSNANNTAVSGLSRSYCALERYSQAGKEYNVQRSISTRKKEDIGVQEQFYLTGLNRSSTYVGVLAISNSTGSGNGVVGGGGKVWKATNFRTKSDGNCDVIYDLDFCSDVAYAVPSNPSMNVSEIRTKYDDYAADLYKNFNYSLQQIQCNTSNETIFSMAVGCDDCAAAYKSWLCAVTIPRCDDYSSTSNKSAVMIRNAAQPFPNGTEITNKTLQDNPVTNRPRNSGLIDKEINPGPYKEILPPVRFCHDLVRNCPMALGFSCPKGKYLMSSYDTHSGASLLVPYSLWTVMTTSSIVGTVFWLF